VKKLYADLDLKKARTRSLAVLRWRRCGNRMGGARVCHTQVFDDYEAASEQQLRDLIAKSTLVPKAAYENLLKTICKRKK
jgi:hypothetical protein